jgi:hypothetical protein
VKKIKKILYLRGYGVKNRRILHTVGIFIVAFTTVAQSMEPNQISPKDKKEEIYPWIGDYPESFFIKARSTKTMGKDHLSVSLNVQHFDWDEVKRADGEYHDRTSGQQKQRLTATICTKYGWAQNHDIAIGIPYWFNDFDIPQKTNDYEGLTNIFIFEQWNFIKETENFPSASVTLWYYFPTGDADRKLGTDDGAYKITTEVSKAWKYFSLHFNPGYTWSENDDAEVGEINGALLLRPYPTFWPAVEYNYLNKEEEGRSHDIAPGFIGRFAKGWSFKIAVPINVESTFTDRDRIGVAMKLFHKW